MLRVFALGLLLTLFFGFHTAAWAAATVTPTNKASFSLKTYWYPRTPYITDEETAGAHTVSGLDVKLVSALFSKLGRELTLKRAPWNDTVEALKKGQIDLAMGAYMTADRAAYAYFSEPYRIEETVLISRAAKHDSFQAPDAKELLKKLSQSDVSVCIVKGFYYGELVEKFLKNIDNSALVVSADTDQECIGDLHAGRVDAILVDRLTGETLIWREGFQSEIEEFAHPLYVAPIYVMFSKSSTSAKLVEQFNSALAEMKASGEYQHLISSYLFPLLLTVTTANHWFPLMLTLATVAAAVSGFMIARRRNFTFIGSFVLAALPALGGGVFRDILVGRHPVSIIKSPIYLGMVAATVVVGSVFLRIRDRYFKGDEKNFQTSWGARNEKVFATICEGAGLAALSVVGVMVALEVRAEPLLLWGPLLAAITSVGGGILCNMLLSVSDHRNLIDAFYLEIPLFWGFLLSLFIHQYAVYGSYNTRDILIAVVGTVIGAFATYLLAVRRGWKGLRI